MRLRSLDVFRGVTMAAMVIVNNPGDWGTVYAPLLHAEWHGWTPTDLVFPFFLFIVGVSMTHGRTSQGPWLGIVRRGATLWGLGLFLAAFPLFRLATLRVPGVLARIAWCYVATVVVVRLVTAAAPRDRARWVSTIAAVLLAWYWVLLTLVPVPDGVAGDLSPAGNLGAWLDRALLGGHLWKADWDPEGLLSTVPAVATTLLGVLAGWWMQTADSPRDLVRGLLIWGLAGVLAGLAWSPWFPINKNLWTSSYVLFTGGLAAASLAVCYWWCDVGLSARSRRVTGPFEALGRNAILLFVLSGLVAKSLIYLKWPDPSLSIGRWIYLSAFAPIAPPKLASLLYALANLALLYALLAALHRRQTYWRV